MAEDNFEKLFKESSEHDREFDFKSQSWDKLNDKLDNHDNNKNRKWLMLLPWLIVSGLVLSNGIMLNKQLETEEKITALNSNTQTKSIVQSDTIIKVQYVHTYDTIYREKTIIKEVYKIETGLSSKFKDQSSKNVIQSSGFKDQSSEINGKNSLFGVKPEKNIESSIVNEEEKPTIEVVAEAEDIETIIDSVIIDSAITLTSLSNDSTIVDQQDEEPGEVEKSPLKVSYELGAFVGGAIPSQNNITSQMGTNIGLGLNIDFSNNFQLYSNLNYTNLFISTNQFNSAVSIKQQTAPDASYTFEKATTSVPALGLTLGARYLFPTKGKISPFLDAAYGGYLIMPHTVKYEFDQINTDQELTIENEVDNASLVLNDFQLGAGAQYMFNRYWFMYLQGYYRVGTQPGDTRYPNYVGITSGLFYHF